MLVYWKVSDLAVRTGMESWLALRPLHAKLEQQFPQVAKFCCWSWWLQHRYIRKQTADSSATAVRSGSCSSACRWDTRNLWRTPNPRQLVDTGHYTFGLERNCSPPGFSCGLSLSPSRVVKSRSWFSGQVSEEVLDETPDFFPPCRGDSWSPVTFADFWCRLEVSATLRLIQSYAIAQPQVGALRWTDLARFLPGSCEALGKNEVETRRILVSTWDYQSEVSACIMQYPIFRQTHETSVSLRSASASWLRSAPVLVGVAPRCSALQEKQPCRQYFLGRVGSVATLN